MKALNRIGEYILFMRSLKPNGVIMINIAKKR